jgi:phosphoribosylglycinamide formyltransferase-1
MRRAMKRIVILISGRGSNMQALLDAGLDARIAAVISNNPAAGGLAMARERGVETAVVNHRDYPDRAAFDQALGDRIAAANPDLIVLAGFMRILTKGFIERFSGRIMNIHPSLLPAFPGTDTHRRALEEGVRLHGCTVHFVTPDLDRGPIIVQAAVPVLPDDDEQRLAARVLEQEHRIYAQAIRWFLAGALSVDDGLVAISAACRHPDPVRSPEAA